MMKVKTKILNLFDEKNPLKLESGKDLDKVDVAFQSYGKLNNRRDNAILVCHALTGNAHAAGILDSIESSENSKIDYLQKYSEMYEKSPGWWDGIIGPGKLLDTEKYFVICSNILGSCYGTTGPTSFNGNKEPYSSNFPTITVRDMVRVQKQLLEILEIKTLKAAIGGSLGGMQVLEWAIMFPEMVEKIIPIATSARHSAWAIGLNKSGRDAIIKDPDFKGGNYTKNPVNGLSLARKIAMISYRSFESYELKFGRERKNENNFSRVKGFEIENYLDYQGDKLVKRFDANSYLTLSYAMDLHDLGSGRISAKEALSKIKAKSLNIGIDSDVLYPSSEQKWIASYIPNSSYEEIKSIHGHDAFLIEFDQLNRIVKDFLSNS